MLQPDLQPSHSLPGEIRHPALPFRIRLSTPNELLSRAIRMEIDMPDLERHELAAPREGLIGHAQQGFFTVRPQTLAGAVDELFDVPPTQRVSLVLTSRSLPPHLLKSQSHGFARARIQQACCDVDSRDGRHVTLHRRGLLAHLHLSLDERADVLGSAGRKGTPRDSQKA